jgi:hypothetical protein
MFYHSRDMVCRARRGKSRRGSSSREKDRRAQYSREDEAGTAERDSRERDISGRDRQPDLVGHSCIAVSRRDVIREKHANSSTSSWVFARQTHHRTNIRK